MGSPLFHSDLLTGHEPYLVSSSSFALVLSSKCDQQTTEDEDEGQVPAAGSWVAPTCFRMGLGTLNREWTLIDTNSLVPSPLIRVHSRALADKSDLGIFP